MNFIAAMLLLNIENEESAFWCLVSIMMPSKLDGITNIGITGLHNWRAVFDLEMSKVKALEINLKSILEVSSPKSLELILEGSARCMTAAFA